MTDEIDLQERFPDLTPIRSAPALFRLNGCGVGLYGSRDRDPGTGTYVKTWCLSLLFLPVLALRAYRVADAERGGWYFVGRVPLSGAAKLCNLFVLTGALVLAGRGAWSSHTSTPEYRAGQLFAEGEAQADRGEYGAAARTWKEAVAISGSVAPDVAAALRPLLDREMAPADVVAVYTVAMFFQQRAQGPRIADDLGRRGLARAREGGRTNPRQSLDLVDVVAPLAPAESVAVIREELLQRLVEAEPKDVDAAVRLAGLFADRGEPARCIELLEPHRDRMKDLKVVEGLGVLGRAYAAVQRDEEAFALLEPYVEERLAELHRAEKSYNQAVEAAYDAEVRLLNSGYAPHDLEARWQAATSEERRQAIVAEYVNRQVAENAGVTRLREHVLALADVVDVALDLGVVRLRRAQEMADPDARRAELEAAERIFLGTQSFAGETDAYRLFLGQVKCWLGRQDEGHALFDELLAARERAPEMLYAVAGSLRAIGSETEARALAEEAYEKSQEGAARKEIAFLRALLAQDNDDQIRWMKRANQDDARVKSSLSMCMGTAALRSGDEASAARHYRSALDAMDGIPENAATLNDASLAWLSLYVTTGDRVALDRALATVERAAALEPSSTILALNAAALLIETAVRDVVGDAIDVEALGLHAGLGMLGHLAGDAAARRPLVERLLAHPKMRDAQRCLERVVLMAPEHAGALSTLATIHVFAEDAAPLRDLAARLEGRRLDLGDSREKTLALYRGEEEPGSRGDTENALKRLERRMDAAKTRGGATLALALTMRADWALEAHDRGWEADLDEAVRMAADAHAAAPSKATRYCRLRAHARRALRDVARTLPAEAERIRSGVRVLGAHRYLAWLLAQGGPAAEAARALPDVRTVLDLVVEDLGAFPDEPDGWQWAILRAEGCKEAARVADALKTAEVVALANRIHLAFAPLDAATACDVSWTLEAAGNVEEGRAVLDRLAAEGVPLPGR